MNVRDSGPDVVSRRVALQAGVAGAAALVAGRAFAAAPAAEVGAIETISRRPDKYHGWPTLARRKDGELLLVCSGGREGHVCPFGRVELTTSRDGGRSWTWPRTLLDSAIDDRDAGVVEAADGSLVVTTFTSLAYEPLLKRMRANPGGDAARLARWTAADERLSPADRRADLGTWALRSTDDGRSWSIRTAVPLDSPHGPVLLADGRLLYAGVELWTPGRRVGFAESSDHGATWRWLADLPVRPGDDGKQYHELHAVEATSGRLVAHIRNHNPANAGETLQSESDDGGKTWERAARHRPVGPAVAPAAARRRPPAVDLRPPPQAVRQPGPPERRRRPDLVGPDRPLRRRRRRRPRLPEHGPARRRRTRDRLVRVARGQPERRPATGPLAPEGVTRPVRRRPRPA